MIRRDVILSISLEGARVSYRSWVESVSWVPQDSKFYLTQPVCLRPRFVACFFSSAVTFSVLKNINFSIKIVNFNLPFAFWDITLGLPRDPKVCLGFWRESRKNADAGRRRKNLV